ncbi:type II toxin-antitoxin system RelE/ParE family toxin [Desulfovibrio sp. OH1186_COT-070]|uniref:type II toxin-antitoxin system RelE/ParE family toxin n=1 Tax=unclassified Desulfovibrio TaxID=2593640 RepID=UPI0021AB5F90
MFLEKLDADAAKKAVQTILAGTKILEKFPNAGRLANDPEPEQKELPIPFGSSGYVVLYEVEGESVYTERSWLWRALKNCPPQATAQKTRPGIRDSA